VVVVEAIVADICEVVRNYFVSAEQLEAGQLVYYCPDATERARKGKTMAYTRLVPVRFIERQIRAGMATAGAAALARLMLDSRSTDLSAGANVDVQGPGAHPQSAHHPNHACTLGVAL
jgi:hypothetical protein